MHEVQRADGGDEWLDGKPARRPAREFVQAALRGR